MAELSETAAEVAASGADAVIVQDLAVLDLFRNKYPSLPIHASTQCAVHNTDSALFYQDLGVSRIILARELSLQEIKKIRSSTNVALECFVHGALCMSLSGGCYLSSVIGGRSGNRGLCAQPCRLDFRCRGREYVLSLKDMSHIRHLREMADAGVCSFKIEGRMKRPEYVAAAVTACRQALRGEPYDEARLQAVFSRSGFTDGYFTGKRGKYMFGYRSKEDVVAAEKVFDDLRRLYDNEQPLLPVKMSLQIQSDRPSVLEAVCEGAVVRAEERAGIAARERGTDAEHAAKFLGKCGGTPFFLSDLELRNDEGLMLPPSCMNAMRRSVLTQLSETLGKTEAHPETDYSFAVTPHTFPEVPELWARFQTTEQLWPNMPFDRVILPANALQANPALIGEYGEKLVMEPPSLVFPETEDEVRKLIQDLAVKGVQALWAENQYALQIGRQLGLRVYGGTALNITNSASLHRYAASDLSAATVSFELSMKKIRRLGGELPRGYIVYGRLPVMRVRNCPSAAAGGCSGCSGKSVLTDRTGAEFPLLCGDKHFSTLLNSVPLHLGGKPQSPADFRLLYFTIESAAECRRATEEILSNTEPSYPKTGGLYYRTVK
ncbi:MAG: U32 family peptidase [Eubacteriales bacterium]|nr:U32 family peptidase [Eubacteriales bacterium]